MLQKHDKTTPSRWIFIVVLKYHPPSDCCDYSFTSDTLRVLRHAMPSCCALKDAPNEPNWSEGAQCVLIACTPFLRVYTYANTKKSKNNQNRRIFYPRWNFWGSQKIIVWKHVPKAIKLQISFQYHMSQKKRACLSKTSLMPNLSMYIDNQFINQKSKKCQAFFERSSPLV